MAAAADRFVCNCHTHRFAAAAAGADDVAAGDVAADAGAAAIDAAAVAVRPALFVCTLHHLDRL